MKPQKKETFRQLFSRIGAMFTFRRSGGKLYTTFTRRLQLIQQVRTLKEQSVSDIRNRLNVEYK